MAVGLGLRPELASDLLRRPDSVDFVEVVAETCFVQPAARREARAFAEMWPVVPHGVKLSLGGAEPIDRERARALGKLARELRAPIVSEHVAFVRAGGREIGHLTPVPFSRAALTAIERNVARARRHLPDVPLALENVACTFRWPDCEMSEGDFYAQVVQRTGCPLLFDVGNLYANAINAGEDPIAASDRFPLDRVAMIHVAGGSWDAGFYFDDHANAVSDGVLGLLAHVLARTGSVPILIERDAQFPPFVELACEVDRCRALQAAVQDAAPAMPLPGRCTDRQQANDLDARQARVAAMLTVVAEPQMETCRPFELHEIMRSRAVLQRKRVDEALPLLSSLAAHRAELALLADSVVRTAPRPHRMAAISDAWLIAERALAEPRLAALAQRELLLLRSRFAKSHDGSLHARHLPFVGEVTVDNRRLWALKGFGAHARVRVIEREIGHGTVAGQTS